jgi:AhpD family alkylhydroperoxidase
MRHAAAGAILPAGNAGGREMHENWPELAAGMNPALKELRAGVPEVMKGFSAIARAALEGTALDARTKELVALGIAVAIRCDPCIAFHAESAVRRGASRAEIMEAMGMAIYMGAGPSVMYAAQAVEAFDQFAAKGGRDRE